MKIFKKILPLVLILVVSGCNVQQRQIRKLDQLSVLQPDEFKRLSNWLNPCFSGTAKSDTVTLPGKSDTTTVTVLVPGEPGHPDTIYRDKRITVTQTKLIHDTVPDTRSITAIQVKYQQEHDAHITAQATADQSSKQAATRLWWIIGLASLIGLYSVYRVYGLITGGALTKLI